jgi:hypothetical protein
VDLGDRIRLGFDRFNARDWDLVARGLPEDFEAVDHLDERSARGPNALKEITTANGDVAFASLHMEPVEIHPLPADGERVRRGTCSRPEHLNRRTRSCSRYTRLTSRSRRRALAAAGRE